MLQVRCNVSKLNRRSAGNSNSSCFWFLNVQPFGVERLNGTKKPRSASVIVNIIQLNNRFIADANVCLKNKFSFQTLFEITTTLNPSTTLLYYFVELGVAYFK